MYTKEILAVVASVLAVVGNVSYLKEAVRGQIRPHPYTWCIWTIVSLVTFFGQLQKGAGIGALPTGVAELFTILIFLVALARSFGKGARAAIRPTDHIFFIAALAGLIPWVITKDPTLSIVIVVTIDLIAFVPTLQKAWRQPGTESPLLFEMNVARHLLTLFSLEAYNIATTLHSVAMICVNTIMVRFVRRKRTHRNG